MLKCSLRLFVAVCCLGSLAALGVAEDAPAGAERVSYYKQIRPIFQANCQGCHQPAKSGGEYVMTTFEQLVKGGESGSAAIAPGKPGESSLIELITPTDGQAEMPKGKAPLAATEIDLIKKWIAEGAVDDTPVNARERYDMDHPPVYTRPPVITSLDFSPDGQLLAVAGFHEVLLVKADGSELVARLVGLSERIESVRFSPDGSKLLVTGGLPARTGEIQVWDVANRKLVLSVPMTYDTLYGGSWSPDGKLIAFGCADNTVRAIDATTGEQVLFQGAHDDWVRDTVFSKDGSHLVSVGRDMTVKLTEVATQRFVDNITSITPGALKGGVFGVARHPERDEVVIGGSDGVAKVYRMQRLSVRVIGDDGNLIRKMPAMTGRMFSVAVSRDGKRIAAGSSLDNAGEVAVYTYEFDTSLPDNIKAINQKVASTRSAEENEALEKYHTDGVQRIAETKVPNTAVYAVAFHPNNQQVAAAGFDGTVRLIDATNGTIIKEFSPAPVVGQVSDLPTVAAGQRPAPPKEETLEPESLPPNAKLVALTVQPTEIQLSGPFDYAQLLISGQLDNGELIDVTRMVAGGLTADLVDVSPTGLVRPKVDGQAKLTIALAGQTATIPVSVSDLSAPPLTKGGPGGVDFIRDVAPVLSKVGCNQGTCHGAAKGKNGFKLSLRGYDPIFDVRALTDDLASRRVNLASPDDSLMLLKTTGAVPHVGGVLMHQGEPYYETIRNWIAGGAKLDTTTPRVKKIEVTPQNPVVQQIGAKQQLRVLATYADGRVRDVTREAFLESGNTEVATANRIGLMTAVRRGEAPILARYEGAYAATTLTVMGNRTGFVWEQPETWGRIDELVAAKWERMKIKPSDLCTDAEFIRRVHLDLTGLPPSADAVRAFLTDSRDTRTKRDELIDKLIGGKEYIDHWTNKWADLLQVNRKFLGTEGAAAFRKWIRDEVAANTPYDQLARKILTANGSNRENPASSYYKILREPDAIMENTTHLFLGVRFNCNKCHDHPFERWTQDQYYETAAYFARVGLKRDPESGDRNIGGTAVEGAKPLYEVVFEKPDGEVKHERTGQVTAPEFPFECEFPASDNASRREQLASWITSPNNPYFAKSYVNRLWGYLFGVGIMEPIDDLRAGNPPTNPELLQYLTDEFIKSGFDARHVIRMICKSRTYQLSVASNEWNRDDKINYSHATARRLPAEVLYDTVYTVTGAVSKIPGVPPGTRAAELPDSGVELPSGFLTTFGRPPRESACECERSSGLQLGPVMALISGPTISEAIADPQSELAKLVAQEQDDAKLVDQIFLRILNRHATDAEIRATLEEVPLIDQDHQVLVAALKEREEYAAPIRAKKEQAREEAIAKTKDELAAYEKELAPKLAEMEKQKAEQAAKLEAELKEYETTLAAKLPEWEKSQSAGASWTILEPTSLKANTKAKLTKEADGSIFAEAKDGPAIYTITAETDLTGITGIRLEALSDDRLPSKGPGLAPGGNFVLTEFEIKAAPKSDRKKQTIVKLENPQADFNQPSYDIKTAIDGQRPKQNNGWAVAGQTGATHWAVFECKETIGHEGGSVLTFTLEQRYVDKKHSLGKFRLAVATAAKPLPLGLPGNIGALLATAPEQRTDEQKAELLKFYVAKDADYQKKQTALADAKKPLPIDPKLKELREKLETVSKPVPEDAKLVQLRRDVEMSTQQIANKRLTTAQDLAWALINSPAFLFNH